MGLGRAGCRNRVDGIINQADQTDAPALVSRTPDVRRIKTQISVGYCLSPYMLKCNALFWIYPCADSETDCHASQVASRSAYMHVSRADCGCQD
jgi:hypothetical protein